MAAKPRGIILVAMFFLPIYATREKFTRHKYHGGLVTSKPRFLINQFLFLIIYEVDIKRIFSSEWEIQV